MTSVERGLAEFGGGVGHYTEWGSFGTFGSFATLGLCEGLTSPYRTMRRGTVKNRSAFGSVVSVAPRSATVALNHDDAGQRRQVAAKKP